MTRSRGIRLLLLAALLLVPLASGHALLEAATPAPGSHVEAGTSALAIRFSETVDASATRVQLVEADGRVHPAEVQAVPGHPQEIAISTDPLPASLYTVQWHALGVDGDLTQGSYQLAVGQTTASPTATPAPWTPASDETSQRWVTGALRWAAVGALLVLAGVSVLWRSILRWEPLPDTAATLVLAVAGLGTLGAIGRLVDLALRTDRTLGQAAASTPGTLMALSGGLLTLLLVLGIWLRQRPPQARRDLLGALLLVSVLGLLVHTLGSHAVAADDIDTAWGDGVLLASLLHVLAVAVWTGGVVGLGVVAVHRDAPSLGEAIGRFSPWAIGSVILLGLSGTVMATGVLTTWSQLWTTGYGKVLTAKTALLLGLLILGGWHRTRLGPRLRRARSSTDAAKRTLTGEAALMALVLLLAGVLASTSLPADPVSLSSGPPAGQVQPLAFDGYEGRLVLPDPLDASESQRLVLDLRSTTFQAPSTLQPSLQLQGPTDEATRTVEMLSTGDGRWSTTGWLLDEPGTWTLTVTVSSPQGTAQHTLQAHVTPDGSA